MVSVDLELISGASNRVSNCLSMIIINPNANDTSPKYLIVYGLGNSVAISDPKKIVELNGGPLEIISGSSDQSIKIWTKNSTDQWECTNTLVGHTSSILSIASIEILQKTQNDPTHLLATNSVDGSIKIWKKYSQGLQYIQGRIKLVQELEGGRHGSFSIHLGLLPVSPQNIKDLKSEASLNDLSRVFLTSGNTDNKLHLFVWNTDENEFVEVLILDGHDDWITSISSTIFFDPLNDKISNSAVSHWKSGDTILATGSQDRYCRLWRMSAISDGNTEFSENFNDKFINDGNSKQLSDMYGKNEILAALDTGDIDKLNVRIHKFVSGNIIYTIEVESVLSAHDGWIHSVDWKAPISKLSDLQVLTSSADQSLLLWKPEADSGVWSCDSRFGEIGGAGFGFFSGVLSDDGLLIVATGYHGSLHFWNKIFDDSGSNEWVQDVAPTGHFESVADILWEPSGRYFLTHSADKTARIYGPWLRNTGTSSIFSGWHEISRPQIHGYDLTCATFITPLCYASGADEKVVRIFEAPGHFVETFNGLCTNLKQPIDGDFISEMENLSLSSKSRPLEASIPPLGLSNKAIYQDEIDAAEGESDGEDDIELRRQTHVDAYVSSKSENSVVPTNLIHPHGHPPLEENLRRRTLWPETEKLYGHPYETFAIASTAQPHHLSKTSDERLINIPYGSEINYPKWLAVSCKSSSPKFSGIKIFDSSNFRPAQSYSVVSGEMVSSDALPLMSHSLTVTRIAFKPLVYSCADVDEKSSTKHIGLMLSVGRDRSISLFKYAGSHTEKTIPSLPTGPFELVQHIPKAHSRIIWDCCWSPDGIFFGTASRDKTVSIWLKDPTTENYFSAYTIKVNDSATSISITSAPQFPLT
ncbi:Elongator complex protein 2 [Smittium mucronatum]|uniref:Elongator complex protein 2 n=1 Tax=Smittium mucronatum TaxID=133383 RepID=A0A1R0H6H3_9FUNG|nr:Elongator complex protein 2 [Smittium mucronatum]